MRKKRQDDDELLSPMPFRQNWPEFLRKNGICPASLRRFRSIIFYYYFGHRREFSWREQTSPYRVFISEVMLQQTQTSRVVPKFDEFILKFPDFDSLAHADFSEILRSWKGLGYNRRARYLQEAAWIVADRFDGNLPDDPALLVTLPGIGPATAASICTFAFNIPLAFIETNIRTVYIHFFFQGARGVDDRQIMELVEKTVDKGRPRDWYYALMDYGVMLKKTIGNLNTRSRHYSKQSRFEGSDRQIRGKILQLLLDDTAIVVESISGLLGESPERVERIVESLCNDNLTLIAENKLTLS